jgi:hypothetical protein
MNTKIIFKALAFAMLMPTMLLTTACSNEDDVVNNAVNSQTVAHKGYALPVTVNVTHEGDATTRATFDGSKLAFSAGDQLFVGGNYDDWDKRFAGTLDYDAESGKFKGTIYTQDDTYKTYEELFGNSDYTIATLLPAGYKDHGYLVINTNDPDVQYDDFVEESNEYTLATSKADGVAQFSYEKSYNYNDGFALSPENAILNFTITGLAASTSVNVSLTSMAYNITGTVTTDASGNATFAAGIMAGLNLQPFSLTVGGKNITIVSSDKVVEEGKIYNIARNALIVNPAVGQVIGNDGKNYADAAAATSAGATAVAKIVYVGSDNGEAAPYNHGLALALSDANGGSSCKWKTSQADAGHTKQTSNTFTEESGLQYNAMHNSEIDNYPAFKAAIANNGTAAPTGCSAWFLASGYQWKKMAGAAGLSNVYWSSSERDASKAWAFINGSTWAQINKDNTCRVRACLAF